MSEAIEKIKDLSARKSRLDARISKAARAVVPVLLDAGRTHSAKELQELFFESDALDQEMLDFTKANFDEVLRELLPNPPGFDEVLSKLRPKRPG